MKRKLALSFLFVFTLAITAPVVGNSVIQEPVKKENCEKKAECSETKKAECTEAKKAECSEAKKANCDKATKAECDKAKK